MSIRTIVHSLLVSYAAASSGAAAEEVAVN